MITINILSRIFSIRTTNQDTNETIDYGTAFTFDCENKQYLITATHLLGDLNQLKIIEYWQNDKFNNVEVSVIGSSDDVTVLYTNITLTDPNLVMPALTDTCFGQDVWFLGYPYKMFSNAGDILEGRPIPFVKKGILSQFSNISDKFLYIDAINNPGFSGGPVVGLTGGVDKFGVIAVVSGYKEGRETITDTSNGEKTDLEVSYNTGLMKVYPIKIALDIISKNPNGFELNKNATLPTILNFLHKHTNST